MDKYGVDTGKKDPKVKEAAEQGKCPECGAPLDRESNVPRCPEHGVRPFEKEAPTDACREKEPGTPA